MPGRSPMKLDRLLVAVALVLGFLVGVVLIVGLRLGQAQTDPHPIPITHPRSIP